MNYQVLARKWRPHSFSEIVGQQHVVRSLMHALDRDRVHHALLFTGTRGVGKTTLARIFAKSLNCEHGVSAKPCGECSACHEVDQGRFIDLIEIDAASRTKVEDTRDLLDNVQYAPTRGRYKVYLIDEVHMLSNHSFNALLKTLEEPPPHVKFILATTDPQRLPVTVLSRCLQFNLKRLPDRLIAERLALILERENIRSEPAALKHIAHAGEGSMRDALTLLDQAIAFGAGDVQAANVATMLGTLAHHHVVELLDALAAGDGQQLLQRVAELDESAPDYDHVLADLLSAFQRIAVVQAIPDYHLEDDGLEHKDLLRWANSFGADDVQLYYQFALQGRRDLPWAPQPRGGFEMILLRMLCFTTDELAHDMAAETSPTPVTSVQKSPSSGAGRARDLLQAVRKRSGDTEVSTAEPAPASTTTAISAYSEYEQAAGSTVSDRMPRVDIPVSLKQGPKQEITAVAQTQAQPLLAEAASTNSTEMPAKQAAASTSNLADWPARWHDIVAQLPLQGIALQLAKQTVLQEVLGSRLTLALVQSHSGLATESTETRLREALSQVAGQPLKLTISIDENLGNTPAAVDTQRKNERQQAAEHLIKDDPNVQALQEKFNASIRLGSVQALEEQSGKL